jgi:hypothetical protein
LNNLLAEYIQPDNIHGWICEKCSLQATLARIDTQISKLDTHSSNSENPTSPKKRKSKVVEDTEEQKAAELLRLNMARSSIAHALAFDVEGPLVMIFGIDGISLKESKKSKLNLNHVLDNVSLLVLQIV